MAEVTSTQKAPIQAQRGPSTSINVRIGPDRVLRPNPNSTSTSGIDHSSKKTIQATRNSPPPFFAAMRGKRQILPVPTAMPSMASIMPSRELNVSRFAIRFPRAAVRPSTPVDRHFSHHDVPKPGAEDH